MSDDLGLLSDELCRVLAVVNELSDKLQTFLTSEAATTESGRSHIALLLENSYTAMETAFLRVSQQFENHLDEQKWHVDLLDKMSLRVTGVREAVVSEETRKLLDELRRFRHFRRYYFEMDYDPSKLDYLTGVHRRVMPLVRRDFARFLEFLAALRE